DPQRAKAKAVPDKQRDMNNRQYQYQSRRTLEPLHEPGLPDQDQRTGQCQHQAECENQKRNSLKTHEALPLSCPVSANQDSISVRAILPCGGTIGSACAENQSASTISSSSRRISPSRYSAVKASISECGNGHDWLP